MAVLALGLVAAASAVSGAVVGSEGSDDSPGPETGRGERPDRSSFLTLLLPSSPERVVGPGVPARTSRRASGLPLEQKVGQLLLVGFRGPGSAATFRPLARRGLGGIVVERANYAGPGRLRALAADARRVYRRRKRVRPWVMAAQEGGRFSALRGLPPARAPAGIASAKEAGEAAAASGEALRAVGVNGVLAPVVDVGLEAGSVIGERAYSDDPQQVASFATATVRAYRRERVFSAAKHFPGLGSASQSTEEGPANVGLSLADLRSRDLIPFMAAIRAQVPGIVVGHGLYLADDSVTPASLSRRFVNDLLRGELRFRGVAITDDLADPPITSQSSIPEAAVRAIKAGADMVFISGSPADQRAAYRAVLRAVREGDVPPTRVNEAVLRILAAKRAAGVTR